MISKNLFHVTHGENKTTVVTTNPNLKNPIPVLLNHTKLKSLKSLIRLNRYLEASHE